MFETETGVGIGPVIVVMLGIGHSKHSQPSKLRLHFRFSILHSSGRKNSREYVRLQEPFEAQSSDHSDIGDVAFGSHFSSQVASMQTHFLVLSNETLISSGLKRCMSRLSQKHRLPNISHLIGSLIDQHSIQLDGRTGMLRISASFFFGIIHGIMVSMPIIDGIDQLFIQLDDGIIIELFQQLFDHIIDGLLHIQLGKFFEVHSVLSHIGDGDDIIGGIIGDIIGDDIIGGMHHGIIEDIGIEFIGMVLPHIAGFMVVGQDSIAEDLKVKEVVEE